MVILASDITETATFYGYDELDTYIEVLAVKAEGIFANWKQRFINYAKFFRADIN